MLLINLYYLNKLFGDYKMVEIKYVPTICPYCGTGCGLNFVVQKVTLGMNLLIGKID